MTREEKQKLLKEIDRKVLGYSSLGFLDFDNDPGKWHKFVDDYFSRSGNIDGVEYTKEQNRKLSSTAMLQTIDEIRKRLYDLLEEKG